MNENNIVIPEQLHERCVAGIRRAETEMRSRRRRFAAAACALAACLMVVAAPTIADALRGEYRNIVNFGGAITGGVYVNATEEIRLSAVRGEDGLYIEAALLYPDDAPYSYISTLSIGRSSPAVSTIPGEIADGRALIKLDEEAPAPVGTQLKIHSLLGEAKAEQPLEINGEWTVTIPE